MTLAYAQSLERIPAGSTKPALDRLDLHLPALRGGYQIQAPGTLLLLAAGTADEHAFKAVTGDNRWTGWVYVRPDNATDRAMIACETDGTSGRFVYQDGPDLCVGIVNGANWAVLRAHDVMQAGVPVALQWLYTGTAFQWRFGTFQGPNGSDTDPATDRAEITTTNGGTAPAVPVLGSSSVRIFGHGGQVPAIFGTEANLLTDAANAVWAASGYFSGALLLLCSQTHASATGRADAMWWGSHACIYTGKGYADGDIPRNRGVGVAGPSGSIVGTGTLTYTRWLDEIAADRADAFYGDTEPLRVWLDAFDNGEEPVAIVFPSDSTGLIGEGGIARALMETLTARAAARGYDGRPKTNWFPVSLAANTGDTVNYQNTHGHPLRMLVDTGTVPQIAAANSTTGFATGELEALGNRQVRLNPSGTAAGDFLNCHQPVIATAAAELRVSPAVANMGISGAFVSGGRGWDAVIGNTHDTGGANSRRNDTLAAGDIISLAAVLVHRAGSIGSAQWLVQAQQGEIANPATARTNAQGNRLATRSGTSNQGFLTVDASANAVDAERVATWGRPGMQPLRPATLADAVSVTQEAAAPDHFTVVECQPFAMHEIAVPATPGTVSPHTVPTLYQPRLLLGQDTMLTFVGLNIHGRVGGLPRRPFRILAMPIGSTAADDHAGYFWGNANSRNGAAPNLGWIEHALRVAGAEGRRVLFVQIENQNSGGTITPGVAADALDDTKNTWAGYTGAVMRACNQAARNVGALSSATLRLNSPAPQTSADRVAYTERAKEIASQGLIPGVMFFDCQGVISISEFAPWEEFFNIWSGNDVDPAHFGAPHHTAIFAAAMEQAEEGPGTAPSLLSSSLASNGVTWTLSFSEPVLAPDAGGWSIDAGDGVTRTATVASGSGTAAITLTLSVAATSGDELVGAYDAGDGTVTDLAGNALASVPSFPITNASAVAPLQTSDFGINLLSDTRVSFRLPRAAASLTAEFYDVQTDATVLAVDLADLTRTGSGPYTYTIDSGVVPASRLGFRILSGQDAAGLPIRGARVRTLVLAGALGASIGVRPPSRTLSGGA